jgi:hypothetical protein
MGSDQNSECSGLETELAFGEVTFSTWIWNYLAGTNDHPLLPLGLVQHGVLYKYFHFSV